MAQAPTRSWKHTTRRTAGRAAPANRIDADASSALRHPNILEHRHGLRVVSAVHGELHQVTPRSGRRSAAAATTGRARATARRSSPATTATTATATATTAPTSRRRVQQRRDERPLHAIDSGRHLHRALAHRPPALIGDRDLRVARRLHIELNRRAARRILAFELLLTAGRDVEADVA